MSVVTDPISAFLAQSVSLFCEGSKGVPETVSSTPSDAPSGGGDDPGNQEGNPCSPRHETPGGECSDADPEDSKGFHSESARKTS